MLVAWPQVHDGLRLLGGADLLWLGVQAWRRRCDAPAAGTAPATGARIVMQGALINILNPKLTLFFAAYLPQFVRPSDPAPMATMGLRGLVPVAQTFVVFLGYGMIAARVGAALCRRPRLLTLFQSGVAALFAGLGLRVILGAR